MGICLPDGLSESIEYNRGVFHKHIWIVDNSGSMNMGDGHYLQGCNSDNNAQRRFKNNCDDSDDSTSAHFATSDCTRWEELQETVTCHALLADALEVPTDFKFLNAPKSGGPRTFRVGYGGNSGGRMRLLPFGRRGDPTKQMAAAMARAKPAGHTPLPASIREVRREVVGMLPQLQADGTRVSLIIVTDGCNYNLDNVGGSGAHVTEEERNQELVEALETLQDLPVSVVIRLTTDYKPLVDFYNSLDVLEFPNLTIDVLDDHQAEAKEVYEHNPWLTYCLLLHRVREMGHYHPLLDLLDERPLTPEEIRDFCRLLYGKQHFGGNEVVVGGEVDKVEWATEFLEELSRIQLVQKRMHWNPQTNKLEPWINIEKMAYTLMD